MVVTPNVVSPVNESAPVPFPDVFLCPMCGSIGHFGQSGFMCTERPAWFRCAACEYVFAFQRPRPLVAAEGHHEV